MEINAWLLGGIIRDNHITEEQNYCWKRKDLIDVPAIIQYSEYTDMKFGIRIYTNNVGCSIILAPYGSFSSKEEMELDYYSARVDCAYKQAYDKTLSVVSKFCSKQIKELDWVSPVLQGSLELAENYSIISDVEKENKELICLIDCSFIYSCLKMISTFVSSIYAKKALSKYEQYQLAYYQAILQNIKNPQCFLTNKIEIDLYDKIYSLWGIDANIEITGQNIEQAVVLFSFLSSYHAASEKEVFSSFLTFFGVIVGLEAIYNLAVALLGGSSDVFHAVFLSFIILVFLIYFIVSIKKAKRIIQENKEFERKTSSFLISPLFNESNASDNMAE